MNLTKKVSAIVMTVILLCSAFTVNVFASDDHGDSFETATTMTMPYSKPAYVSNGTIGVSGDEDYFKLTAPQTGTYIFYTTGSTDTKGYLYNSSYTQLAYNDDNAGINFGIQYSLTAGQTYYIKVTGYGSTTGAYTLHADIFLERIQMSDNQDARFAYFQIYASSYFDQITLHCDSYSTWSKTITSSTAGVTTGSYKGMKYWFVTVSVPTSPQGFITEISVSASKGNISVNEYYDSAVFYSTNILTGISGAKTTLSSLIASQKTNSYTIEAYNADGTAITNTAVNTATGMVLAKINDNNHFCYNIQFVVLFGDVNGDGLINLSDVTKLQQHIEGWESSTLTGAYLLAADVNHDGAVTEADTTLIMQYIANHNVSLGQSTVISSVPDTLRFNY